MTHAFLSTDWMAAARAIREKYADEIPAVDTPIRINLAVTDVPFDEGMVNAYLDTSSGAVAMELGELDESDATITTDYETAQALFVEQDQAVAMQAFMSGKIKVQGDYMKLTAIVTTIPGNEFSDQIADEIRQITATPPSHG